MFKMAIVLESVLHEVWGLEQSSKLPKMWAEKGQEETMLCQVSQAFSENN